MDNLGRRSDPLDVVTKSDIDEIKLYKTPNAIIHGDPTINNGQVSNFSAQNYLAFPFIFDFREKAFVLVFSFTTSDDITTAQNVIGSNYCIAAFIVDGYLHVRASSNGNNYDIFDVVSDKSMAPNTTYYYMIKFDRLTYYIGYSNDGGRSFLMEHEIVSTLVPKPGRVLIGLGNNGFNPFKGIINLNYWYLIENKVRFWDGMDDAGLSTRLATDLENIDDDGIERIVEIVNDTVAQADPDTSGIMKLYDAVGTNTDGTMTQKAITEALSGVGGETEELIFEGSVSKTANQTITMPRTFGEYRYIVISVRERVTPTRLPSKSTAQNHYYALQMTPRIRIDEEMLLNSASYYWSTSGGGHTDFYASQIGIPVLELTAGVSPKVTSAPHFFFLYGRISGLHNSIETFFEWLRGYNQFTLNKADSNADITTKTVIYRITGVLK